MAMAGLSATMVVIQQDQSDAISASIQQQSIPVSAIRANGR